MSIRLGNLVPAFFVLVATFSILAGCTNGDVSYTTTTVTSETSPLSEQSDMATFQRYFSDMGLGKMKPGDTPSDLVMNATVFTKEDLISLYAYVIEECEFHATLF